MQRKNAANEDDAATFRDSLVYALFADGQVEAAYRQPGDVRLRVKELSSAAANEKDAEALKRLIAVHELSDAGDPALPFYRGVLHWVNGDYDAAMRTMRTVPGHLRTADQLGPWWESLMIRSLLRTQQHQEALRMATMSTARDEDPYFEVIVHAVMGNVEATMSAMQTCIEIGYVPDRFYDDGRLRVQRWRLDAFAPLREKFPPYDTEGVRPAVRHSRTRGAGIDLRHDENTIDVLHRGVCERRGLRAGSFFGDRGATGRDKAVVAR